MRAMATLRKPIVCMCAQHSESAPRYGKRITKVAKWNFILSAPCQLCLLSSSGAFINYSKTPRTRKGFSPAVPSPAFTFSNHSQIEPGLLRHGSGLLGDLSVRYPKSQCSCRNRTDSVDLAKGIPQKTPRLAQRALPGRSSWRSGPGRSRAARSPHKICSGS
ncbi:hypothetical protein BU26DRAFT_609415 [Trematosphaeria pertusa]|uniref:Uncharacterized protein n=1 Tax=Trematosphaeria pertusa TaxID=390896 RepID=A0A6A6HZ59_9PLEO|nr:uncharacterized protein BU26DRAFT_609415 [Trematosphaeria pertusa]KAF2243351.1 hypothetical protein BU26DRAFT_609415 [Trematosphaeria pertusa]